MSLWPWPELEETPVGADQPVPKYAYWRRVRPEPEPIPCARCKVDARVTHLLVDGRHYCMTCGIAAAKRAQR